MELERAGHGTGFGIKVDRDPNQQIVGGSSQD